MAGEKNLLNKLVLQARSLDDDALASFANKGLVRRAKKDFSSGENLVTLDIPDESLVKLQVDDSIVTLTKKGLSEAICDCPATEVCRHVLIGCFWLAEQNTETAEETESFASIVKTIQETEKNAFQELLELSLPDLEKAVGKKAFAQGVEFIEKNSECRIIASAEGVRLFEFTEANVSVRLLKDADFAGHLCSCRKQDVCRHKIAAILAFRRENGIDFLPAPGIETVKSAVTLAPSQFKVLQKTTKLFQEFVEIGVAHLSKSSVEQLQTLATSAGGTSLFRLSFALKSLADGLNLSLERSAQGDETAWLVFLSKTYALCSALLSSAGTPNPKFIGVSRTSYEEIGSLEINGVGAYQWQTQSGYHGISILFWDNRAKRFFSWTDARPKTDTSFTPYNSFVGEMGWQGVASPSQAASSIVKLQNAARNSQNRLSGSAQIQAFVLGGTDVETLDFASAEFSDWKELRRYFAAVLPCGLRERETFKEFVVVHPNNFGNRFFDGTTQTLIWQVFDENEDALEIRVAFNSCNESAIQNLEKLDAKKDEVKGILVRLALSTDGLYLQPISLFLEPKSDFFLSLLKKHNNNSVQILQLNLAGVIDKKANAAKQNEKSLAPEIEIDENVLLGDLGSKGTVPQRILVVREVLQNLADSGTNSASVNTFEKLTQLSESLDAIGLSNLAKAVLALTKSPREELSKNLLKLVFLTELSLETAQTQS